MKFETACLLMVLNDNDSAIDWAMFTGPNEELTADDVKNYSDMTQINEIYAYPVLSSRRDINEIMTDIDKMLETHKPLTIPGVFQL